MGTPHSHQGEIIHIYVWERRIPAFGVFTSAPKRSGQEGGKQGEAKTKGKEGKIGKKGREC